MADSKISALSTATPASTSLFVAVVNSTTAAVKGSDFPALVPSSYIGSTLATGDIIVGVAGAASTLAAGSSGDVLTVVSGVPAWAAPAGGSTTFLDSIYHPDRPPAAAGAGDDEFASTVLNVAWTATGLSSGAVGSTWVSTGTNIYDLDYMAGSLSVLLAGTTGAFNFTNITEAWSVTDTNAWSVCIKCHVARSTTSNYGVGITAAHSSALAAGVRIRAQHRVTGNQPAIFWGNIVAGETASTFLDTVPSVFDPVYLGMYSPAASSAVYFANSRDGIGWHNLGTAPTTAAITHLAIGFAKDVAYNYPQPPIVIDWIRTSTGASLKMGA